jgi:hypothetical protein
MDLYRLFSNNFIARISIFFILIFSTSFSMSFSLGGSLISEMEPGGTHLGYSINTGIGLSPNKSHFDYFAYLGYLYCPKKVRSSYFLPRINSGRVGIGVNWLLTDAIFLSPKIFYEYRDYFLDFGNTRWHSTGIAISPSISLGKIVNYFYNQDLSLSIFTGPVFAKSIYIVNKFDTFWVGGVNIDFFFRLQARPTLRDKMRSD